MEPKLSEEQLRQVVAEVSRMTERQSKTFDREQVQQILEELQLPPELLDEALLRVNYRESMTRQHRGDRRLLIGLGGVALTALVAGLVWFQAQRSGLDRVASVQDRITLAQDAGALTVVDRQLGGELFYRVTLNEAPVGDRLALSCDWINPGGQIVRQNRYETQKITSPVWNTYCRHDLAAMEPGRWTVQMSLGERMLDRAEFVVR